ncbi:MAG: nucleotidyltransferase domain-containing protein [Nanoarchaeota archaeon]|nr:nucleotidyltransferase domain-containing protein [Nanoarchaeota archaeon]
MLNTLKEQLESEKDDRTIFDIVLYGSAMKGKESPKDIDILVIFLEGTLKERLDRIQEIKSKLKKIIKEDIDIKQILLKELFSPAFLAKTGILLEGFSVFSNSAFSDVFGFSSYTLFWYSLDGLTHAQKVRFNYILAGRGTKGVIEELNGKRIVNGAIKIPINNSAVFEEILRSNNINYHKKNIMEEI